MSWNWVEVSLSLHWYSLKNEQIPQPQSRLVAVVELPFSLQRVAFLLPAWAAAPCRRRGEEQRQEFLHPKEKLSLLPPLCLNYLRVVLLFVHSDLFPLRAAAGEQRIGCILCHFSLSHATSQAGITTKELNIKMIHLAPPSWAPASLLPRSSPLPGLHSCRCSIMGLLHTGFMKMETQMASVRLAYAKWQ